MHPAKEYKVQNGNKHIHMRKANGEEWEDVLEWLFKVVFPKV